MPEKEEEHDDKPEKLEPGESEESDGGEEYDDEIASLLDEIAAQQAIIAELTARVEQCESELTALRGHKHDDKPSPEPEPEKLPEPEPIPEERNAWFRTIGKR